MELYFCGFSLPGTEPTAHSLNFGSWQNQLHSHLRKKLKDSCCPTQTWWREKACIHIVPKSALNLSLSSASEPSTSMNHGTPYFFQTFSVSPECLNVCQRLRGLAKATVPESLSSANSLGPVYFRTSKKKKKKMNRFISKNPSFQEQI